ncbi:hypothetical protein GCM10009678_55850 [Actinomadura kijaniata]|uniref:Uncharacterized protein YbjT (DUF2867 family) n=1 Tax=Actinomadura namibiensis TaxID=182080 RepID=A0A7W3QKA3_ACTNM|nr:NAD(P)H-binding protein [Actinomadura namibiensis]MBA8950201.1 uncharacterized protein YbjT (DUF2867 family) [Actinomadura namibiensis]
MTILVTGATGQIGRRVVDRLVRARVPVRAISRAPENAALPRDVRVVRGDLTDPDSLDGALDGVERVYLFPVAATAKEVGRKFAAAGCGAS